MDRAMAFGYDPSVQSVVTRHPGRQILPSHLQEIKSTGLSVMHDPTSLDYAYHRHNLLYGETSILHWRAARVGCSKAGR